jgi:hypothetical protein
MKLKKKRKRRSTNKMLFGLFPAPDQNPGAELHSGLI